MRTARIEVYRSERRQWKRNVPGVTESVPEWRWRLRASNGRIISQSSEGYRRARDLVRGLELSHPGCEVFYDGEWWLMWTIDDDYLQSIPISVPEGVSLNSRRSR